MKTYVKSNIFGSILSNGSFKFVRGPSHFIEKTLPLKKIDIINHTIWAGTQTRKQTEISGFVRRIKK